MGCLFDGVSDIDTSSGRPWMQNVPGGTICGWLKPTVFAGFQTVWGAFGNTGTTRAKLTLDGTGKILTRANALDADATSSFTSSGTLIQNGWNYVASVFNFFTKSGIIYIFSLTGGLVNTTTGVFANMTAGNTSNTVCGASAMAANETRSTNSWTGLLEDVRVYNRALSQAEVTTIFEGRGHDGIISGMQARWPLNTSAPNVAASNIIDLSTNNFGGAAEGTILYQSDNITVNRRGNRAARPAQGRIW